MRGFVVPSPDVPELTVPNPALRVFSWSGGGLRDHRQITPMVWLTPEEGTGPGLVADRLKRFSPGTRVLHIFHPCRLPGMHHPFDQSDPTALVRRGSLVGPEHVAYYTRIFARIANAGGAVDRVVLDYEGGYTLWHMGEMRVAKMASILGDRAARSRLPEIVREQKPEAFASSSRARAAYIAYNAYAYEQRARALAEMIIAPARAVFGDALRASNYNDARPRFEVYDRNGWPIVTAACGTDDSPELYLLRGGNRYKNRAKHPRWNRFIDCLNHARASAHNARLSPWISPPGYQRLGKAPDADPYLWTAMLLHLLHMGVRDFILWNPKALTGYREDTQQMDAAFAALAETFGVGEGLRDNLDPIELDADEVTTGAFTTSYEDFLDHVPAEERGG